MIRKYCRFLGFSVNYDGSEEYHCHYWNRERGDYCNCECCLHWEKRNDHDETESEVE